MQAKIKSLLQLRALISKRKKEGERVVFTNGCFDILHAGHVNYLESAKKLGNVLVVGLNSDNSVKRLKGGGRPINNQTGRARVLAALESVDYVVFFNEPNPLKLITTLKPDVLVKGGDWSVDAIIGAKEVHAYGGMVKTIRYTKGYSTTQLIKRIKKPIVDE